MAFSLTTLTTYADQLSAKLIPQLYYKDDVLSYFVHHPGVNVGTFALNYFDITPTLMTGEGIGPLVDGGTTTFNQKNITVCNQFTQGFWSPKQLQLYWLGMEIEGVRNDNLKPVEEILMEDLIAKTGEIITKAVWDNTVLTNLTGTTGTNTENAANCFGLYQSISGDTGRTSVDTGTTITVLTILGVVKDMINSLTPELVYNNKLIMFMSLTDIFLFKQAWFNANNFQYPAINEQGDIIVESWGPKFVIHPTFGLTTTNMKDKFFLTTMENLHEAHTGDKDEEKVAVWFETYLQEIVYRVNFRLGVTFWRPQYVVTNF